MLRRANSETEARKIFAQAEAALDTETEAPPRADVRAACTIGMLGEEYLRDSVERGKQPRTMEQRESRLKAHILRAISDMPVAKWRVEHSRKVMEKGSKTIFSNRGREDLAAFDALVAPDRDRTTVTDLLPPPKRRRRSA